MGLLDKVKAVAKDVAVEAKKGTAQIQGKMETGQLRKKADEAAKQLGYLVAKERTEGTPAGDEADRLVQEIVGLESQIGVQQDETAAKLEAHEAGRSTAAGAVDATAPAGPAEPAGPANAGGGSDEPVAPAPPPQE